MLISPIDENNASVSARLAEPPSLVLSMLSSNLTLKSPSSIVGHPLLFASALARRIQSKVWPFVSDGGSYISAY